MPGDVRREQRAARNENMFRQVNERLHVLAGIDRSAEPVERFVCECAQASCSVVVELTPGEYRSVRSEGARFLVAPDPSHTEPLVESVIERCDRYWVVEKFGEAGAAAEDLADDSSTLL